MSDLCSGVTSCRRSSVRIGWGGSAQSFGRRRGWRNSSLSPSSRVARAWPQKTERCMMGSAVQVHTHAFQSWTFRFYRFLPLNQFTYLSEMNNLSSPSCRSKTVWPSFFYGTEKMFRKMFMLLSLIVKVNEDGCCWAPKMTKSTTELPQ